MKNNVLVILSSLHRKQSVKLAGIMVAFLFVITILVSPANAVEITKYMGHGIGGNAFVDYESECSWNYAFLYVSEAMYKDGPGKPISPGPMAYLEVGIDEWCIGWSWRWGYAEIELTSFEVGHNLGSIEAEGTGTISWTDFWCWPSCIFPEEEKVSIKVKFTGENSVMSGTNTIRVYEKGIRTIIHYSGTTRLATATGLIKGETFEMEIKPPPPPPEPPPPGPGQPPYPYIPFSNADIGRFNSIQISVSK